MTPVIKVGDTFGRLIVLALVPGSRAVLPRTRLRCDCGATLTVIRQSLSRGQTQSCGCLNQERRLETIHGHAIRGSMTPEYRAWYNAKQRTTNPNVPVWSHYGGRGIRMCAEWLDNFRAFLAYVGLKPDPSLSLDRIDNDGDYEPGNVRWATKSQQAYNRRPRVA